MGIMFQTLIIHIGECTVQIFRESIKKWARYSILKVRCLLIIVVNTFQIDQCWWALGTLGADLFKICIDYSIITNQNIYQMIIHFVIINGLLWIYFYRISLTLSYSTHYFEMNCIVVNVEILILHNTRDLLVHGPSLGQKYT